MHHLFRKSACCGHCWRRCSTRFERFRATSITGGHGLKRFLGLGCDSRISTGELIGYRGIHKFFYELVSVLEDRKEAIMAGRPRLSISTFSRVGTPLAPYNVRRTSRGILRNAGLAGMDIAEHSFCRAGATLLSNELGMQAAADILGHTSTSTTRAHCAEFDRRVKSEPAKVMQRLAPPP